VSPSVRGLLIGDIGADVKRSILEVIGHRKFGLQTGGVIPVVVKVEYDATPTPTTSLGPSGTAPACAVDPTTTSLTLN
jgi:hypothetical protein